MQTFLPYKDIEESLKALDNARLKNQRTEALELIKNSTVFDQFITDAMQDYEQFTIEKKEQEIKNSKSTSTTP